MTAVTTATVKPYACRGQASESGVPGTQTVFLKTQGCSHNVSDGEYMAGLLASYGYNITQEWSDDVDVFLFNSCTVKGPSQDSFLNMVSKAKESGKVFRVGGSRFRGWGSRALNEESGQVFRVLGSMFEV